MARFCENCGAPIGEGEKFCQSCGTPVGGNQPVAVQNPQPRVANPGNFYANAGVVQLQKFSFISVFLLSIVTCGIYGFYFMVKMADNVHALVGRKTTASGAMLIILTMVTCGIYAVYFYYEMAMGLNEAKAQRNIPGPEISTVATLLLMLFGLGVIPMYWLINGMNQLIDYELTRA